MSWEDICPGNHTLVVLHWAPTSKIGLPIKVFHKIPSQQSLCGLASIPGASVAEAMEFSFSSRQIVECPNC